MIRRHYLYLAAGFVGVLALACGGGGGGDELERALQSVTDDQLAIMVLPKEELGDAAADLPLDSDPGESGFQDNQAAADDTFDPDDTAADIEQAGRVNGYELSYSDFSRLGEGEGAVEVDTAVELYKDADAASAGLARFIDDLNQFAAQDTGQGFFYEEVKTFTVSGLGDEAVGIRARFKITEGDITGYTTFVAFRVDRLLAGTVQVRNDDKDVNSQLVEIMRALEERMKGVLLGDITGTPVPIPSPQEGE